MIARMAAFTEHVNESEKAVYDPDAPGDSGQKAIDKCFEESVSGGDIPAMAKNIRCSLLKTEEPNPIYAFIPYTSALKKASGGQATTTIKVVGNGGPGTFMNEEQFYTRYGYIVPGVLTVGGHAGARADQVSYDGTIAVIKPVPNPDGEGITHLQVDVGGVAGDGQGARTVAIEQLLSEVGIKWVLTAGQPAREAERAYRRELAPIVATGQAGETEVRPRLLVGDDRLRHESMRSLGALPTDGSSPKAIELAQYFAVIAGSGLETTRALTVCLAEYAKRMGSDLQGNGPGDEVAAEAGRVAIESWGVLVAALPSGVLSEVAEHQFPGGLNVRDDTVAPAVVAAHIRKVIEGIVFT